MVPSANWSAARSEERRLEVHLAWDSSGRWLAAGILFAAALYELSPLKHVCLRKC
jgi:predicted metal-binding membrane protein